MSKKIDNFSNLRLEEGSGFKVVVKETEMSSLGLMKMDVVGTNKDLQIFYRNKCEECRVKNTTTGLNPEEGGMVSFSCVTPINSRWARECDPHEEEKFKVPEDNWFSIAGDEMDVLLPAPELEMRMVHDPDFEIILMKTPGRVCLLGSGRNVLDYWQNMCSICPENTDKDLEMADFSRDYLVEVECEPETGPEVLKMCDINLMGQDER